MNRSKRIAPRIISRSYVEKHRRIDDIYCPENHQPIGPSQPHLLSPISVPDEMEEDLVVKGGVVVRLQSVPPHLPHTIHKPSLELTKVALPSARPGFFQVNNSPFKKEVAVQLPGVADEVESYPCPVCGPEKVFLTVAGLEKHGKEVHPQFSLDIIKAIERIQEEWKRRRGNRIGLFRPAEMEDRAKVGLLPNSSVIVMRKSRPQEVMGIERKGGKESVAEECGKEDNNLICKEPFSLLITNPKRLVGHLKISHAKKKRFVCRWCGKVYGAMTDLNVHKSNVHNISMTQNSRYLELESSSPTTLRETGDSPVYHRNVSESDCSVESDENLLCHAKCQVCGLVVVRPSLLLRHMLRVHNQKEFGAEVSTQNMPPLKFFIDGHGRVSWSCCGNSFADRGSLLYHRSLLHGLPTPSYNQQDNSFPSHSASEEVLESENPALIQAPVVGESVVVVSSSSSSNSRRLSPTRQIRSSFDNMLDSD